MILDISLFLDIISTERLNFETGNVTDLFASNFARARDATAGCVGMVPQWNHDV